MIKVSGKLQLKNRQDDKWPIVYRNEGVSHPSR